MITASDTQIFTVPDDAPWQRRALIKYRYWRADRPKMLRTNTWGIGKTVDEKP